MSRLSAPSPDDVPDGATGILDDVGAPARFAQQVVGSRGQVSDADLAAVRGAGYTDPQVLAIVAVPVQVLLTDFVNNVNRTDIDIPAVSPAGTPG